MNRRFKTQDYHLFNFRNSAHQPIIRDRCTVGWLNAKGNTDPLTVQTP